MAKETIDYFSSDKSIFDAVISTITNTYNKSYSYLQLSDVEIKKIVNKIIKNCKEDIKEDDVLERIVAEFKKEINIIIRNYDHFTLINNYVDTMLSKVKTYNSAIKKIGQLSKFLTLYDIILDPDEVSLLIEKNSIFNKLLELVAEEKKSEITNEPLSIIFEKNDFLCLAMGVYCLLNNIDVKEENYGEEELDDNKNSDKESESFTETYSGDLDGLLVGTRRDNYSDESVVDSSSNDNTNRQTKKYYDTGYTNGDQVFMSHASKEVFTREEEIIYFDFYNSLKKLDNIFENAKKVYKNELPLEELKKRVEKILVFEDSINEIIKQLEYKRLLNNKDEGKYFDGFSSFNDFKQLFRWAENILSIKDANNEYKEWASKISKFNKKITFYKKWIQEEIVNHNIKLVRQIALKYNNKISNTRTRDSDRSKYLDDLTQAGNIGLLTAIERFDLAKKRKFSTYATWWIRQAINRYIANNARTIRIPVYLVEALSKFNNTYGQLTKILGREPTISELAAELGKSEEEILEIIEFSKTPASLNTHIGDDEDTELGDMLSNGTNVEGDVEKGLLVELVKDALDELPKREAEVLRLRFGLEDGRIHTLEDVGAQFGLTRERIRQIEKKAIGKLRHPTRRRRFKDYVPDFNGEPVVSKAAGKKTKKIKRLKAEDKTNSQVIQHVEEEHVDENKNGNGTDKNFYIRVISGGSDISDDKKIKYDTPEEQEIVESRLLYILNTFFPYSKNVGTWNALFDIFGPDLKSGNGKFSDDSSRIFERRILLPVRKQLKEIDWKNTTITDELKTIPNGGKIVEQKRRVFRKEPDGSKGKLPVGGLTDKTENNIKPENTLIASEIKKESVIAAVSDKQKGSEEPKTLEMPVISEKLEAPIAPILPDVSNPLKTASMPVQPNSNDRSDQLNSGAFKTADGLKEKKERKGSKRTKKTSIKNKNGTDKNFYVRVISGISDLTGDNKYKYDTPEEQEIVESRLLYILNKSFPYSKNVGTWNALFDIFGSDLKSGNGKFSDDSSRMFERRILLPVRKQLKEIDWKNTTITDELKTIPNDGKIVEKHVRGLTKESEASAVGLSAGQEVCKEETDNKPEDTKMPKDININITLANYGLDYISFNVPNVTEEEIDNVLKTLSQEEQQMYANMTTFGKTEIELLDKICQLLKSKREKGSANFQRESVNETKVEEKFDYVKYIQGILNIDASVIKKEFSLLPNEIQKKLVSIKKIDSKGKLLLEGFTRFLELKNNDNKIEINFSLALGYILTHISSDITLDELNKLFQLLDKRKRKTYENINEIKTSISIRDMSKLDNIVSALLLIRESDEYKGVEKHKVIITDVPPVIKTNLGLKYIKDKFSNLTDQQIYATIGKINYKKIVTFLRTNGAKKLLPRDKRLLDGIAVAMNDVGIVSLNEVNSYFDYLEYVKKYIPDVSFIEVNDALLLLHSHEIKRILNIKEVSYSDNELLTKLIQLVVDKREEIKNNLGKESPAYSYVFNVLPDMTHEELDDLIYNNFSIKRKETWKRLVGLEKLSTNDKKVLSKIIEEIIQYQDNKKLEESLPLDERNSAFIYIRRYISDVTLPEINEVLLSDSFVGRRRAWDCLVQKGMDKLDSKNIEVLKNIISDVRHHREQKERDAINKDAAFEYIQSKIYDVRQREIDSVLLLDEHEKYKSITFISEDEKLFLDAIVYRIIEERNSVNVLVPKDASISFKYLREHIEKLKQDEIDEGILLLSVDQQKKFNDIKTIGEEEEIILNNLIRCIIANREIKRIDALGKDNAAYVYIAKHFPGITLEEIYVVLSNLNVNIRKGYEKRTKLPANYIFSIREERVMLRIVEAITLFRKKGGDNAYIEKIRKYTDYVGYIKSVISDVSFAEIENAISSLEDNLLFVFNNVYRNPERKYVRANDFSNIDILLDTLVTIIKNNRLGIATPKLRGNFNSELCFYDFMARRLRANNNQEFKKRIDLICEYLSIDDNSYLEVRFGKNRNIFNGHGTYSVAQGETSLKNKEARIISQIVRLYTQSDLLQNRIRCSNFYGYVACKLRYPEGIEETLEFRKKVDLATFKQKIADVSYLKTLYGDDFSKTCKVPLDESRTERIIINIKDQYLIDNPYDDYYESTDNSRKKPFNQYFADYMEITITPDIVADFDMVFSSFSKEMQDVANQYWGTDHNVYCRNPKWNYKKSNGLLSNFITSFKTVYTTLVKKKNIRKAYNIGLIPFIKSLIGDKVTIDVRKVEYVILKKIRHKFKCEFIAAFGHNLSETYDVDEETYNSLLMIIPRQFKHDYINTTDSEVDKYFAENASVMKKYSNVEEKGESNNCISSIGRLLTNSIGDTIRKMDIYSLVNYFGLSLEDASVVSYVLHMPYDFDLKEVSIKLGKSESEIRKILILFLNQVKSSLNTSLGDIIANFDDVIVKSNGGRVRLFSNPELK